MSLIVYGVRMRKSWTLNVNTGCRRMMRIIAGEEFGGGLLVEVRKVRLGARAEGLTSISCGNR